jgi:hypothetical protein
MTNILPLPLFSGDSFQIPLIFWSVLPTNPNDVTTGTVQNLTGTTVGCTIKGNQNDTDAQAVFKDDIAGDTTGKITFSVPGLNAGSYWIDIKMWNSSNARSPVIGPTQFTVNQSITDRAMPSP